jgi:hypothetical protein
MYLVVNGLLSALAGRLQDASRRRTPSTPDVPLLAAKEIHA